MDLTFWKGVFIGLLVAFPTGPVGFLTLRRGYLFGVRSAMYSTIGAVMTDAFYGVVVGFGLKKIARSASCLRAAPALLSPIVL
jgi:threonine/homoserine/homoserine lactone efflux protein